MMLKCLKKTSLMVFLFFVSFMLAFADSPDGAPVKLKVIVKAANIRLRPDIKSTAIRVVTEGTILESEGKEGGWYKVTAPSETEGLFISGYIHGSLVMVLKEVEEEVKAVPKEAEIIKEPAPVAKEVQRRPALVPSHVEMTQRKARLAFRPYVKGGFLLLAPSAADLGFIDAEGGNLDQYLDVNKFNFGGGIQLVIPLGAASDFKVGLDLGAQVLFTSRFDTGSADGDVIIEDYDTDKDYDFYVLALVELSPMSSPLFLQAGVGAHFVYWIWDSHFIGKYSGDQSKTESGLDFNLGISAAAGINLPIGENARLPIFLRLDYLLRYGSTLSAGVCIGLSF